MRVIDVICREEGAVQFGVNLWPADQKTVVDVGKVVGAYLFDDFSGSVDKRERHTRVHLRTNLQFEIVLDKKEADELLAGLSWAMPKIEERMAEKRDEEGEQLWRELNA